MISREWVVRVKRAFYPGGHYCKSVIPNLAIPVVALPTRCHTLIVQKLLKLALSIGAGGTLRTELENLVSIPQGD